MIHGAEYAPIAALDPNGIRAATAQEIEAWASIERSADEDHGTFLPTVMVGQAVVWGLDVANIYERRIIWRLAALQLGVSESEAEVAVMLRVERDWWVLRPATYQSRAFYLARVHAPDLDHATAALCTTVWGPA